MNHNIPTSSETDQNPGQESLRRKRRIQVTVASIAGLALATGGYVAHNLASSNDAPQHQGPSEPTPTMFTPTPDLHMTPGPETIEPGTPDNK